MKLYLISLCILVSLISVKLDGQSADDDYNVNANQEYVTKKMQKKIPHDGSSFDSGFIIRKGDTISCVIYMPKHKLSDDGYLYILARTTKGTDSLFTAKDIEGYVVDGITMKSHRSISKEDTSYFFIRKLADGRVTLYQREPVPSDNEFLYYFERPNVNDLLFLAPYRQNYTYIQERFKDGEMVSRYNTQNEDQFRTAFSEYLKDCTSIRNKILSRFYTVNDLEVIIKEYNGCKK